MTTPEPVSRFPDDASIRLWRQRQEPPMVTVRCGRGTRRCDRVAYIYDTPGSAVVVFYQDTPDQPAKLSGDLAGFEPDPVTYKHFDPSTGQAMLRGRKDERGTVVCLEDDDYWSNVVEAGCRHHMGFLDLSRPDLMSVDCQESWRGRCSTSSSPTLER